MLSHRILLSNIYILSMIVKFWLCWYINMYVTDYGTLMDGFKQECKLCGNIIRDENYKVIEDVIKSIFDILLLKLTLDNDIQNVICTMCSSKLLAALNFKSSCLYTDNSIIPHVDFENLKSVDLKDIYANEKGNKQGDIICRLCLQPVSSDHKSIRDVPLDSVQIYMPEIINAATTNPAICLKCHDALCVNSSFIRNCLDVEENRKNKATNVADMLLANPCIKTEEIEIKSEETDYTLFDLCNLKKEENDNGDGETKSLYDLDDQTSAQSIVASYKTKECIYNTAADFNQYICENGPKHPSEAQMYGCYECDYKTIRKCHLRQHELKHKNPSEVRMYTCDQCQFITKYKESLTKHYLQHKDTSEVKMFECEKCHYKSIRKDCLKKHQLRHENPSEVRVFECDECDFKTLYKGNLNLHQLRHKDPSDMPVFKCDECDFQSTQKHYLKRHKLRHKDPSEVQMFKCDECDYESVRKADLKSHQLKHKNPSKVQMYMCDKCKFLTKYKQSLVEHYLQHKDPSEVLMFKCGECDYKSVHKGNFKKHQMRHKVPSDMPVFKCDDCDYKSFRKNNLKQHLSTHKKTVEMVQRSFSSGNVCV